jgi:CO dehydrogenase maturation factor
LRLIRIMILGFLGKGGSGKSSVSSQTALHLNAANFSVLGIDADHNMDLSYNLSGGDVPPLKYFSQSLADLQKAVGLAEGEKYTEAFLSERAKRFALTPLSPEIEDYSHVLDNNIRLMTAGPQTDGVLYGTHCSHSLTTSLKILLPLLEVQENEVVVVDEKAGADGVSTGIVTGIDVGVIVCEPALHSIKTAKQIAALMDFYETPYVFVGNKVTSSEDKDFIISELGQEPVTFLMASNSIKRNPSALVAEWTDELQVLFNKTKELNQNNRLERTVKKFKRNHEFART